MENARNSTTQLFVHLRPRPKLFVPPDTTPTSQNSKWYNGHNILYQSTPKYRDEQNCRGSDSVTLPFHNAYRVAQDSRHATTNTVHALARIAADILCLRGLCAEGRDSSV